MPANYHLFAAPAIYRLLRDEALSTYNCYDRYGDIHSKSRRTAICQLPIHSGSANSSFAVRVRPG